MNDPKTMDAMEADVRRMAGNLRPLVVNPGGARMPDTRDRVTVSHLVKALEALRVEVEAEASTSWALLAALTGAGEGIVEAKAEVVPGGPVFEGLARQIGQVSAQVASLRRAHEALGRALS